MIYAETKAEVEKHRRAFLRKWRLKCKAVADSLKGTSIFATSCDGFAGHASRRGTEIVTDAVVRLWLRFAPPPRAGFSEQLA